MTISINELKHLARLSCIDFADEELKKIGNDLNKIIAYIAQLKEVNTDNISPLISVNELETPFRSDKPRQSLKQEKALQNAPDRNSDYFRVPKVLG